MSIQQTWNNPNVVQGYQIAIIGDATSLSQTFDFYGLIASDSTVANKNPSGIYLVNVDRGVTPTTSLFGSRVTFTWSVAPDTSITHIGVLFTFEP